MTMDYGGGAAETSLPMGEAVLRSLSGSHRQLGDAYRRAGSALDSTEVWGQLGATPMIGVNDTLTDVFTRADGKALVDFAREHGLGRLSMWSANRDAPCPGGPDPTTVSNTCSGLAQAAARLQPHPRPRQRPGAGRRARSTTTVDPAMVDDPATSPYPVWDRDRRLRAGRPGGPPPPRVPRQVVDPGRRPGGAGGQRARLAVAPRRARPRIGPAAVDDHPPGRHLPGLGRRRWPTGRATGCCAHGVAYEAAWFAQGVDPAAPPTADGPSPWRPLADG